MDLPGGAYFYDVTRLFTDASEAMRNDEIILAGNFGLGEAMSAIEIGDHRMDSGASQEEDKEYGPFFDPYTPLLPEEVCWILDEMLSCEVLWQSGHSLSQSVYTCQYVHRLSDLNPTHVDLERISRNFSKDRPMQLIFVVLRAGVLGAVKCCDLVYRELAKGKVIDGEDWLGDKADVSLCEALSPHTILQLLEEAQVWLQSGDAQYLSFRDDLLQRITLRKRLLELSSTELPGGLPSILPLVTDTRKVLAMLKRWPFDNLITRSPPHSSFDRRIFRYLHTIVPLQPLATPSHTEVWRYLSGMLDGWECIAQLASGDSLISWITTSELQGNPAMHSSARNPFLRSTAQSVFSDGGKILGKLPTLWLVDRFLAETTHIQLFRLNQIFELQSSVMKRNTFDDLQRMLAKLLLRQVVASFYNRPRHRRHLMKADHEWCALHEQARKVSVGISAKDKSDEIAVQAVQLAILHWRIRNIKFIVITGFELDLYGVDERPFAYWYLKKLCIVHSQVLDQLCQGVPSGCPADRYLAAQASESHFIGHLSSASFTLFFKQSALESTLRSMNFAVRYKWTSVFRKPPSDHVVGDSLAPNFTAFLREEEAVLRTTHTDARKIALESARSASEVFSDLSGRSTADPSIELCRDIYNKVKLAGYKIACDRFVSVLAMDDATTVACQENASEESTFQFGLELFTPACIILE